MGRKHPLAAILVIEAALVLATIWLLHVPHLGDWLRVHLGIVDEAGPYYGFWSGFGSDLAEISVLGAIGTGVYQLVKKFNCHQPGCWRVGNHPAAGGQFMLCYRHHPDYQGRRPGADLIERLHREHNERQGAALHQNAGDPRAAAPSAGRRERRPSRRPGYRPSAFGRRATFKRRELNRTST